MSNNKRRDFHVDSSEGGAIVPVNRLQSMLQQVQQQGGVAPSQPYSPPMTVDYTNTQPVEVRYVNAPTSYKPRIPQIEIPYVETWKAHRLHPQNPWRFVWYPVYFLSDVIKSPVGVGAVGLWLFVMLLNFLLNGSYTGPGYASGKKIEVVPKEAPQFALPVVKQLE
ncbi:hypothetical protein AB0758_45215 [Tolypothrix bouteillei VB521301_2]|uniref:Uncharacterized protein n=1 Tax=Tolypothrix bouteillei VB521301 TaxID=1479485 RepID=A0A0C1RE64_9CYAN